MNESFFFCLNCKMSLVFFCHLNYLDSILTITIILSCKITFIYKANIHKNESCVLLSKMLNDTKQNNKIIFSLKKSSILIYNNVKNYIFIA